MDDNTTSHDLDILKHLETVEPYAGDQSILIGEIDIEQEIKSLEAEIKSISLDSIPFSSADFVVAF